MGLMVTKFTIYSGHYYFENTTALKAWSKCVIFRTNLTIVKPSTSTSVIFSSPGSSPPIQKIVTIEQGLNKRGDKMYFLHRFRYPFMKYKLKLEVLNTSTNENRVIYCSQGGNEREWSETRRGIINWERSAKVRNWSRK